MEYQTFIHTIKQTLTEKLSSSVSIQIGIKEGNNGMQTDTLILKDSRFNIAPSIYLTPYFSRYQSGMCIEDICEDIILAYQEAAPTKDFDIEQFTDYQQAKNHICMRLINFELNKNKLKNSPHIRYLDLAIVFVYVLSDVEGQTASIFINNSHKELWNVSTDVLYEQAKQLTQIYFPLRLESMQDILEDSPFSLPMNYSFDEFPMIVISNQQSLYGATAILYPSILRYVADQFQSDLLLIPSSIHEMILMPLDGLEDARCIDGMIKDVNALELQDSDVLSDHAYYYDKKAEEVRFL